MKPRRPRVLLAEDDPTLRRILSSLLSDAGLEVHAAPDGLAALEAFTAAREAPETSFDAVLSDISMPGLDGLELIEKLHVLDPSLPLVFLTAYSSVDSAIQALRKGAYDYLTKPFQNEQLVRTVSNACASRVLLRENAQLRREVRAAFAPRELIRTRPGLAALQAVVEKAAPTQASILIRGETGSGKEVVARALHQSSTRADGPFLAINCAALPEALLESELFGHEAGAFTGAVKRSTGLLRSASGGTLFLDEIGELSPAVQAKLLRVLETREVRPVGSAQTLPVDVRLLSATHRDLLAEVEAGRFREDLFYRLAVIELEVPPLRAHPGDVLSLSQHFLERFARERAEPLRVLSPACRCHLLGYAWPGNVRELLNALEHAVTLGGETLELSDLPLRIQRASPRSQPEPPSHLGAAPIQTPIQTLAELERLQIERVLAETAGDRKRAADLLGVNLSTLYRKLKRWEEE